MIIPKKSLGQNFLKDKNIIKKIINLSNITNEKILEVGPGFGSLTDEIIKLKPENLIIIEKDNKICNLLKSKFKYKNVTIINEDIMNYNFDKLFNYKIISNLPYNISSKFLLKILKYNKNIKEIICMIQSELAEKFNYRNGKMNKYKFISKYCSHYEIKFNVSSNVFFPKPKVKSTVVKFSLKKHKINNLKLDEFLNNFFINRRKIIGSNKAFFKLINNEKLKLRYEELDFEDVLKIYERF